MEPEVKKKTNGKRNRSVGHVFERTIANKMKEIGFPHVVTTRSESRGRDNQGIDLMNKDELVNGRLPYNIQCKSMTSRVPYAQLLRDLPADTGSINVVLHQFTEKKGTQFYTKGHYAILDMNAFLDMAKRIAELEESLQEHKFDLRELKEKFC